jgi:xylose dehydrogenase (NAD/NADP)
MTSSQVRFGVIGAGRVARTHVVPAILNADQAVLWAAASREKHRAEALGPQQAYDSYDALLQDPGVDAVYIATHNGLHRELVLAALERGAHVLCEKPLGRTAAECEEMVAAADASGCLLMEAFMYRYHPQLRKAQELVRASAIGELKVVEASFRVLLTDSTDVRMRPEWGGGALLDVGCYCVNVTRLFLGDVPRNVRAWARIDAEHGIDTSTTAVLEYASGTHAVVSCGFESGPLQRVTLVGTDGAIDLTEPFVTWQQPPRLTVRTEQKEQVVTFEPVSTFRLEVEDFCTTIRSGTSPVLGPTEGLLNARILDRVTAAGDL